MTIKASTAGMLSLVMLGQTAFAYKPDVSLWNERKSGKSVVLASAAPLDANLTKPAAIQRILSDLKASPVKTESHSLSAQLPAAFLSEINIKHATQGSGSGVVVILEDVHQNVEAQRHLSSALLTLASESGTSPVSVALEGAVGEFLFDTFHKFPSPKLAREVVDSFLESGDLAGPSHAGFASFPVAGQRGLRFTGADDAVHYVRNVDAYKSSEALKARTAAAVSGRLNTLLAARTTTFSKDLLALDISAERHHRGEMPLSDYVAALAKVVESPSPVISRFLSASQIERKLDMGAIERERRLVLERLVSKLSETEIRALVQLTFGYRQGQVTFGGYYAALERLCQSHEIDLARTPAFNSYLKYVLLSDSIQADALFAAIESAETAAYAHLATTPAATRLVVGLQQARRAQRLLDFALTSAEWTAYKANTSALSGLDLSAFERFYKEAEFRDAAMVKSVSSGEGLRVLVAGGFHTESVSAALRKLGLSVIVGTPRLTKVGTGSASSYLSVFDREKTPLDMIFSGQKLFLAAVPAGTKSPLLPMGTALQQAANTVAVLTAATNGDLPKASGVAQELGVPVANTTVKTKGNTSVVTEIATNGDVVTSTVYSATTKIPLASGTTRRLVASYFVDTHVGGRSSRTFLNRVLLMIPGLTLMAFFSGVLVAGSLIGMSSPLTSLSWILFLTGFALSVVFMGQAISIYQARSTKAKFYTLIPELKGHGVGASDLYGPVASVVKGAIVLNGFYFDIAQGTSRFHGFQQRSIINEERRHLRYQERRGLLLVDNRSRWSLILEEIVVNYLMPVGEWIFTYEKSLDERRAPQRSIDSSLIRERADIEALLGKIDLEVQNPGSQTFEEFVFVSDQHGEVGSFNDQLMDRFLSVVKINGIEPIDSNRNLSSSRPWTATELDSMFARMAAEQGVGIELSMLENAPDVRTFVQTISNGPVGKIYFQNLQALLDEKAFGPEVAARAKQYIDAGFDFHLDAELAIDTQMARFGFNLSQLKGKLFIHNIGDFMDRGDFGIKVFLRSVELHKAGISDFVPGNHDFWVLGAVNALHLPFYNGFDLFNYKDGHEEELGDVADILARLHARDDNALTRVALEDTRDPRVWSRWLAEFMAFNKDRQEKFWNEHADKPVKALHAKMMLMIADESVGTPEALTAAQSNVWDRLRGFKLVDVYTGTRDVSGMSPVWWAKVLKDMKDQYALIAPDSGEEPDAFQKVWLDAIKLIEDVIIVEYNKDFDQKVRVEKKPYWRIFQAINDKAYTSPAWAFKDWLFHEGWGPTVLKELTAIMQTREDAQAKLENRAARKLPPVTAANFLENPIIMEIATFFKSNFKLYGRDIHQTTYMHSFLPVDLLETITDEYGAEIPNPGYGEFYFKFKGDDDHVIEYRGKGRDGYPSVWEGLDKIARIVQGKSAPAELSEAMALVQYWYGDNTTEAKPPTVSDVLQKLSAKTADGKSGARLLGEKNGFHRLVTGHIPLHEFKKHFDKKGFPTGWLTDDTVAFSDGGTAEKFGLRGYVIISNLVKGFFNRGRESKERRGILDNARTVTNVKDMRARETEPSVIFTSKGIAARDFILEVKRNLEERLRAIDAAMGRTVARSLNNRAMLALPFVAILISTLFAGEFRESLIQSAVVFLSGLGSVWFMYQFYVLLMADLTSANPETRGALHWAVARYSDYRSANVDVAVVQGGQIYLKKDLMSRMTIAQQISILSEEMRHVRYQRYWGLTFLGRNLSSLALEEIAVNIFMPLFEFFRPNPEIRALRNPYSVAKEVGRVLGKIPVASRVLNSLSVPTQVLETMTKDFMLEMEKGVSDRPGSLEMVNTGAILPTGRERGINVSIDWGGSKGRVTVWELGAGDVNGRITEVRGLPGDSAENAGDLREFEFTLAQKKNPRALFTFITQKIDDLVKPSSLANGQKEFSVGITFAFPATEWSKDWEDGGKPPMDEKELIREFNKAFDDLGMKNVRANASANDTLEPMFVYNFQALGKNPNALVARISMIIGTGFNLAAIIRGVIRNFEGGAFGDGTANPILNPVLTEMDRMTDAVQENKKKHLFEKLISGNYLGEILRNSLLTIRAQSDLFAWDVPAIQTPKALKSIFLSQVIATAGEPESMASVLAGIGVSNATLEEQAILYALSDAIVERSARLAAMTIAATIRSQDPALTERHVIPIEGSVFSDTPRYADRMMAALVELLGAEAAGHVQLIPNKGFSGAGAALIAATANTSAAVRFARIANGLPDNDKLPLNLRVSMDDGTQVIRVPAIPAQNRRALLLQAASDTQIERLLRIHSGRVTLAVESVDESLRDGEEYGRIRWNVSDPNDPSGEISGTVSLTLVGNDWIVTANTTVEEFTVEALSHVMGVLAMHGFIGSGVSGGTSRALLVEGTGSLGLTLIGIGVLPLGMGLLFGALASYLLISLRFSVQRSVLIGSVVGLGFISPVAGVAVIVMSGIVAAYRTLAPAFVARQWLARGRRYANAVTQQKGRNLVDVLNENAPNGLFFGRATANDLRNATLSGYVASAQAETNPASQALQWAALEGYRRSVPSDGTISIDQAAQRYTAGVKVAVASYHLNQVGEAALESEFRELEALIQAEKNMRTEKSFRAVVIPITGTLPDDYQARLNTIVRDSEGVAIPVSVTEDFRTDDGLAYSYERILAQSMLQSSSPAVRALLNGSYDTASFVTFSKIPSQFQANGRLRAIWTILANMGAGWAPLPVDTLLKAAEIAQQQA